MFSSQFDDTSTAQVLILYQRTWIVNSKTFAHPFAKPSESCKYYEPLEIMRAIVQNFRQQVDAEFPPQCLKMLFGIYDLPTKRRVACTQARLLLDAAAHRAGTPGHVRVETILSAALRGRALTFSSTVGTPQVPLNVF